MGGEEFSQPSNKLDNRFGEIEPRQSEAIVALGRLDECESPRSFAVPSSSSSSSDSCKAASRLMVDWEGSKDAEDTLRDFDRRYHSSGTQNRNIRFAEDDNGLGEKGKPTTLKISEEGGNLENSG